jgi:hypothetical protein
MHFKKEDEQMIIDYMIGIAKSKPETKMCPNFLSHTR